MSAPEVETPSFRESETADKANRQKGIIIKMSKNLFKKKNYRSVVYTILTFLLLSVLFLALAGYLYKDAEERAMETLHVQTKQIKDDLTLQMLSDRENLATMANFAAKLYLDGDDYSLLFDSFKPIGLISNIGILTSENIFITKNGSVNLGSQISHAQEAEKGAYISGRVRDLTNVNYERVRSAVPIVANGETVGILYGIIKLESIEQRYIGIATELDAQLFVYEGITGDLVVDSIHDEPGNISFLKDRKYQNGYSYEKFATTEKGFSSFRSAYKDEDVLLHYSTLEEIGWKIAVIRYDSQVYAETHTLLMILLGVFMGMVIVMCVFSSLLTMAERRKNNVIDQASNIRKILIEASGNNNNSNNHIAEALKAMGTFTQARSVAFFDTNDEDYLFIAPEMLDHLLPDASKKVLKTELFHYVSKLITKDSSSLKVVSLSLSSQLQKSKPAFYALMKEHNISEIVFSATVNYSNHITILCVFNPKRRSEACYLVEKVAACFTIALNNHNHLNRTQLAATTDSLTGTLNRVAYNNELHIINEEKPFDFSCIYIDVNELHYRNNQFGHAAGDEMLLFIAHTLKDVFYGQKIYRLGGDEFLVFCRNLSQEEIKKNLDLFLEQLATRDYHIAFGVSFRSQNTNTEEMVKEAEIRMYENKAKYYQNKGKKANDSVENEYLQAKTGISEIDTMLSILKENYNGIYRVSLDTDRARRILMPAYLKYNETEEHFSKLFATYVSESAEPDYHRSLLSFQNYGALVQQLEEGKIPKITYRKLNGEMVTLSVHKLCESDVSVTETLWVFAKK